MLFLFFQFFSRDLQHRPCGEPLAGPADEVPREWAERHCMGHRKWLNADVRHQDPGIAGHKDLASTTVYLEVYHALQQAVSDLSQT